MLAIRNGISIDRAYQTASNNIKIIIDITNQANLKRKEKKREEKFY